MAAAVRRFFAARSASRNLPLGAAEGQRCWPCVRGVQAPFPSLLEAGVGVLRRAPACPSSPLHLLEALGWRAPDNRVRKGQSARLACMCVAPVRRPGQRPAAAAEAVHVTAGCTWQAPFPLGRAPGLVAPPPLLGRTLAVTHSPPGRHRRGRRRRLGSPSWRISDSLKPPPLALRRTRRLLLPRHGRMHDLCLSVVFCCCA